MPDFFISYQHNDEQWAEWIAYQLKAQNYSVHLQAWNFQSGPPLIGQINDALANAAVTILVLSPEYFKSPWCEMEWQTAVGLQTRGDPHRVLPIMVRPTELPPLIGNRVWLDLKGVDKEVAKKRLLDAAVQLDRVPTEEPVYPGGPAQTLGPEPRYPGSLPPVNNITHRRNLNFTGRVKMLDQLHGALTDQQRAAVTQAVHGLGGVGKTQLAVEYLYRHAGDYDVVWWVRCEQKTTRLLDLAALAGPLRLPEATAQDQTIIVEAVKHWLGQHTRWLLILDNVVQPADIKELLPTAPLGHTIITSRNPNWSGWANTIRTGVFTRQESIAYLLDLPLSPAESRHLLPDSSLSPVGERLGEGATHDTVTAKPYDHSAQPTAANPHPGPLPMREEEKRAGELADELGDLPLALAQAKAYIAARHKSIEQYLRLFRERRQDLWRYEKPPVGYEKTITETYSLAIDQIRAESPDAESLLTLCAFVAPDNIPRWLLDMHVADEFQLDERLALLARYSLAELTANTVSIHRLVQIVCRDHLTDQDATQWIETAVKLVNRAFPNDVATDPAAWPICAALLPHATSVIAHCNPKRQQEAGQDDADPLLTLRVTTDSDPLPIIQPDAVARLLNQMGIYQRTRAQFAAAEPLFRRAVAIVESVRSIFRDTDFPLEYADSEKDSRPPDVHPRLAGYLNNLAQLLQATNRLAEGEPLMRCALAIDEQCYGAEHPEVATDLNNLAQLLQATNRLAEAEPLMRRALAIDEQSYGPEHPRVATKLNSLAQLLQATNRLAEAEPLMRRALAIEEQSYGAEHPNVAIRLNNLAALLQATNRLAEAEPRMRRALAISEQSYGDQHPNVAVNLNNLALLLKATNRLAEAEPLMRRALAIDDQSYGAEHPRVAIDLNNLALLLQATNRLAEAEPLMRRALAIDEQSYGAEHPRVAIDLNNLAALLQATNRLAEAEPLMRRALAIDEQSYGAEHPDVARDLNNLALLLQATNRLAKAEPLMRRSLAILRQSLGNGHPKTQTVDKNLGLMLREMASGE